MKVRLLVTLMLTTLVPAAAIWSDSGSVEKLLSPAPAASLTGNLVASGDALYLSWLEELPHGHALRFSVLEGTTFSEPRTIHTSDEFFANWADFASMAPLADGRLVAHWLEKAAERLGAPTSTTSGRPCRTTPGVRGTRRRDSTVTGP